MRTLTVILDEQMRFGEAEEEINKVMDAEKTLLTEGHPDRIRSAKLLGEILRRQKRYLDAETVLREAYTKGCIFTAGPSLLLINLKAELASVLLAQGRHDEAMELQIEALALRDGILPARDLNTYNLMSNLAHTFNAMGKITEERDMHWEVLKGLVELSSFDIKLIVLKLLDLAKSMNIQPELHDVGDILPLCISIMQAQEAQTQGDWASVKSCVTALSKTLLHLGRSDSGLELARRFRDHSDLSTVQPVMALFQTHLREKGIAGAEVFLEELIADYTSVLGPEHLITSIHTGMLSLVKDHNSSTLEDLQRRIASIAEGEGDEEFPRSALVVWLPALLREVLRARNSSGLR